MEVDGSSIVTTASVRAKVLVNKEATKMFDVCSKLLRGKGIFPCPSNFVDAIKLCLDKKLISQATANKMTIVRKQRNKNEHNHN